MTDKTIDEIVANILRNPIEVNVGASINDSESATTIINITDGGWRVYEGNFPQSRQDEGLHRAICVAMAGGEPSNPRWAIDKPIIKVMVRGNAGTDSDAKGKLTQIKNVLTGYYKEFIPNKDDAEARENGFRHLSILNWMNVMYDGRDEQQREIYSLRFKVIWTPVEDSHRKAL